MSDGTKWTLKAWLAAVAVALVLATARCGVNVELGVAPGSDAGASDAADARD